MNLKVGRVCPQRAGLRMQNGSGALGTDAPYHYWVQGHNARVCSGNSPPVGEGRSEGENGPARLGGLVQINFRGVKTISP